MKKLFSLTKRNFLETVRDPLSAIFCIVFPLVMLVFITVALGGMDYVPEMFEIKNYASGICVFGYMFVSMFTSMQIAGDKNTSFIKRINISPIKYGTYLLSFVLSAIPVAIIQTILFFAVALLLKYPLNANLFFAIIYLLPSMLLYILLGVLIGVICSNEKQTGPISSIIITSAGMLGGIFMPINTMATGLKNFANALPFVHTVSISSEVQSVGYSAIYPHILYILGYISVIILAIFLITKLKKR